VNTVVRLPSRSGESLAELVAEDRADIARILIAFREDRLSFHLTLAYYDIDSQHLCVPVENATGYTADELRTFFKDETRSGSDE